VEAHILLAGQVPIEAGALEDDPDPLPDRTGLGDHVESVDQGAAIGRRERRREDRQRRRLAGAVRAEQREELAGADVEGDAVDRVPIRLPIALDEVLDMDCRRLGERHRADATRAGEPLAAPARSRPHPRSSDTRSIGEPATPPSASDRSR